MFNLTFKRFTTFKRFRSPRLLTAILASLGMALPAQAQITPEGAASSGIANDLNFPNNSQRFFNRGRSNLEWEIYLMQEGFLNPDANDSLLTISPDFFEKQEQLFQQLERPVNTRETDIRILEPGSIEQ